VLQCVVIVSTMVTLAVAVAWHLHGSALPSWGAGMGLQAMAQRVRDIQVDPAEVARITEAYRNALAANPPPRH
jgi:hypothetical protein